MKYIWIVLILLFPLVFFGLEQIDPDRGLIWFWLQQLYYYPLGSWMGEPLFKSDGEIIFKVQFLGRLISPLIYICFIFVVKLAFKLLLKKLNLSKHKVSNL